MKPRVFKLGGYWCVSYERYYGTRVLYFTTWDAAIYCALWAKRYA